MEKKIELTQKERKEVDKHFQRHQDMQSAVSDLALQAGELKRMAWDRINELFPETKDVEKATYNIQTGVVTYYEKEEPTTPPIKGNN